MGEAEGDDFRMIMEFQEDGKGTLEVLGPGSNQELEFERVDEDFYRVKVGNTTGFLSLLSERRFTLFGPRMKRISVGLRLGGEIPSQLQGRWVEGNHPHPRTWDFEGDQLLVSGKTGEIKARVYPVRPGTKAFEAVFVPETPSAESRLYFLQLLEEKTIVVWSRDSDDYWLLQREGHQAKWWGD